MPASRKPSRPLSEYHDSMKQIWLRMGNGYYDQFGFEIRRSDNYKLFWKEKFLVETLSIEGAKQISLVLINDRIMHT